jgi:hypothetical protein
LVGGGVGIKSLIDLIKWLKGKPKKIEKLNDGYNFTNQQDSQFIVSKEVGDLYQNCNIQKNIYYGYAKPLEDERTEAITTGVKEDFVDTEIKTDKNDLPSFKDYYKSNNEEEEIESISEDFLTIKNIAIWIKQMGFSD